MGVMKEFKEFAVKGNVVDMAVGVIMGAAFGKIVSSFVADIVTPPLGILIGGVKFEGLKATIKDAVGDATAVTVNYGQFIQTVFDFAIVALAMFLLVKVINGIKRKQEESAPPVPAAEFMLLAEIRDILRSK